MPRRVQDIVPNKHRSIRDIPVERNSVTAPIQPPKERGALKLVPKLHAKTSDVRPAIKETLVHDVTVNKEASVIPPNHKKKKIGSKKWLYILMGIVIVVAGVGYVASVYFSYATFVIVPKIVPISVNSTYIAQNISSKDSLTYELAVVKGGESVSVIASDGPKISTSAKGKVTLHNSYSDKSQRLIAGTRLSDVTGRIYRLTSSVVIPGYTSSGGKTIPGSIVTSITADQPGDSYNITKSDIVSDLKIVAYKGTSKYENMYGRLATDIIGGFVGVQKMVTPTTLASTTARLQSKITASLIEEISRTIPEGYIFYSGAYVTSFGTPTVSGIDSKSATVTLQGNVYGILFKRIDLIKRVAGDQALSTFDTFAYDTPGLESLDFSIANQKDFSPTKKNTLIIKLKGDFMFVGSVPVEELKSKFAGLSLTETETVLRGYKPVIEIEKSSGEITPPWSKVPSNPNKISIEVLTK